MAQVETVAILSDVHFPKTHLRTLRAFEAWLEDTKPDRLVMLGDMLDLPSISSHSPDVTQSIHLLPPIKGWCSKVKQYRSHTGHIDWLTGNHTAARWYRKFIEPHAHQLKGLEDCMSLESICRRHGLPDDVTWLDEKPPAIPLRIGNWVLRHGDKQSGRFGGGVNVARTLMVKEAHRDWSALFGHYHRPQVYTQGDRTYAIAPHLEADVAFTGGVDGWCRGWSVLYHDVDAGRCHLVQYLSNDGRFVAGGRVYDGAKEGGSVGAAYVQPAAPAALEPHPAPAPRRTVEAVPKQPAEKSSHGFSIRVVTRTGRSLTKIRMPNAHGRWVEGNTAQAGAYFHPEHREPARLVQDRLLAWEKKTGLSRTELTWDEFVEIMEPEVLS